MANQPKQPKAVCSLCGYRTRQWKHDDITDAVVCADPDACQQRIKTSALATETAPTENAPGVPQDASEEAQATDTPAESEMQHTKPVAHQGAHARVKVGSTHEEFLIPLSGDDIEKRGRLLARASLEVTNLKAGKAEEMAEWNEKIKKAEGNRDRIAQAINSGSVFEYRSADIYFEFGTVTYVDPVSGFVYKSRPVQPGEQFRLPVEEQVEEQVEQEAEKPTCFGKHDGPTDGNRCSECTVAEDCGTAIAEAHD